MQALTRSAATCTTAGVWRLIYAPRRTFEELSRGPHPARVGVLAVLAMGASWASFLGALAVAGHQPSGPLVLPIARESYYGAEALFVVPVHLAMFGVLVAVLTYLGRGLGGVGNPRELAAVAGLSMAAPSIFLWLLPDVAVVATAGFSELGSAMRFYVPLSIAWTVVLLTAGVRAVHRLSLPRAISVALAAALLHWPVGAPFLR
jgi:hypothetical protein